MPKYDLKTIQALEDLNLIRTIKFGLADGYITYKQFALKPEEMLEYLEQGESYILHRLDIDADLCAEWRAECGDAKCAAMLKNGERLCDRVVGHQLGYHEWVQTHRKEYCSSHWRQDAVTARLRDGVIYSWHDYRG